MTGTETGVFTKKLRLSKSLTQAELAKDVGLSKNTIGSIEKTGTIYTKQFISLMIYFNRAHKMNMLFPNVEWDNYTVDSISTGIGETIKKYRTSKPLSRHQLAHETNLSIDAVKRLELGENMKFDSFIDVLNALSLKDYIAAVFKEEFPCDTEGNITDEDYQDEIDNPPLLDANNCFLGEN